MCGIIGYTGHKAAQPILLEGLHRLEYRGYDSAGVAVASKGAVAVVKKAGSVDELERALAAGQPLEGSVGLGHTRWATHGRPTDANAHPFTDCTGQIALIHNGIIENHAVLRDQLKAEGHVFRSETDTEVMVHLIERAYKGDIVAAFAAAIKQVEGTYAFACTHAQEQGRIAAARRENPLVVGFGEGEMFLASDVPALLKHTRKVVYLEDGEIASIDANGVALRAIEDLAPRSRAPSTVEWDIEAAEKAGYKHFMLKEIYEQPRAIADAMLGRIGDAEIDALTEGLRPVKRVKILACGSSAYAGLVGRYLIETIARVPTSVEIASEYRYTEAIPEDALIVAVTQSGETLDTLNALREAKRRAGATIGITNVMGSSVTREVNRTIYTRAGPEIGVAASKTFTTQVVALTLLALSLGRRNGELSPEKLRYFQRQLRRMPQTVQSVLWQNERILEIAKRYAQARDMYFIGRHVNYPSAVEGAHKMKEISYLHAEAYAAGELKHGALALLGPELPVVAVAVKDPMYAKMLANIGECTARGAPVIAIGTEGDTELKAYAEEVVLVPEVDPMLSPVPVTVALQLLAYHIADLRGCSIDRPRNLAKTVTVE